MPLRVSQLSVPEATQASKETTTTTTSLSESKPAATSAPTPPPSAQSLPAYASSRGQFKGDLKYYGGTGRGGWAIQPDAFEFCALPLLLVKTPC
jgi:hypothetical protein